MTARALAGELRAAIEGEVRFDAGSRALYAHDLSIYRQVPIGVVVPRTIDDVVTTVAACRAHDVPILPRGAGTSLVGQCTNVAVVIDFSKYLNRIVELDPERKRARVEPGVICDQLRDAAEAHALTFGPDPATHAYCTLGGMLGNNSCGVHSVMAGRTSDNVEELEILTYDGARIRVGATSDAEIEESDLLRRLRDLRNRYGDLVRERFPDIPRRVSGYNLDELLPENGFNVARALVASEGTCAVVLGATVRLVDSPQARVLVVIGYPEQFSAADDVIPLLEHGPIGLEGFDESVTETMQRLGLYARERAILPPGGAWLLAEFGGATRDEAVEQAQGLVDMLGRRASPPAVSLLAEPHEQAMVWLVRESALGASRVPRKFETWPSFEDAAVPPARLGDYLRDFCKLLERHGYTCVFFGHYGQGCVHCRINFDLRTREGLDTFKRFLDEGSDLVLAYGGSLSGEHGDGQAHGHHLRKMYGDELVRGFREFKAIWDPRGRMNPAKLIDADPVDAHLRIGPDHRPAKVSTYFSFHEDGGSFAAATERCFGMGRCRRPGGGTMCPSYMVTREEKHSTRGRAHLLFELLQGEAIGKDGWRDEAVKDALDLCLACKGCKGECPVHVDIATYKAEFLAHYYERRLRPPAAYALGFVDRWARLAARAPGAANLIGGLGKPLLRIAPERTLPRFARQTFRDWFAARGPRGDGERVLLWPDTFSNHFQPEVAIAAVEVLETAGFRVELPRRPLCCGRPLYDFGFLGAARGRLRVVLDALRAEIDAGVPVVGLEPSCVAVFRDELLNLFPEDELARRLSRQTFLLPEFLAEYESPQLARRALVHGHCHQKALVGMAAEEAVLGRAGVEYEVLDSGCCGMAGSFGYERRNYEVSVACAERVLLPAVRAADPETLIVADGYSCREQIAQLTGRHALHLAQVLRSALS